MTAIEDAKTKLFEASRLLGLIEHSGEDLEMNSPFEDIAEVSKVGAGICAAAKIAGEWLSEAREIIDEALPDPKEPESVV